MKKITKTRANNLMALTLALGLYSSLVRAEEPQVNFESNALETALVNERNINGNRVIRNRLIINIPFFESENLKLSYSGLNEIDNWDSETYFGRNRFILGKSNFPLKFLVDTKIGDTKFGGRVTGLMEWFGSYGYVDLSTNQTAQNLTLFHGRSLKDDFSLEFLLDTTFQGKNNRSYFTEVQLNKKLTEIFSLFGRTDARLYYDKNLTILVGISINLEDKNE